MSESNEKTIPKWRRDQYAAIAAMCAIGLWEYEQKTGRPFGKG